MNRRSPMIQRGDKFYTVAELRKLDAKVKMRRAPLPPSHQPHACVVLSVDTAKCSGWAMYAGGHYLNSGEVSKDDSAGLLKLCLVARQTAARYAVPCVLVLEKPPAFVYRRRTASTMVGLGAAREAWERAWRDAGGVKRRIVRAEPDQWRKPVLGVCRGPRLLEIERSRAVAISEKDDVGADEQAAIGLGYWAIRAGEVASVLPKGTK